MRTKIAFLYSELAGYFLACAEMLAKDADVLIIHWPINAEAPFQFNPSAQLQLLNKNEYSVQEIETKLIAFNPDKIVCNGWMDKDYLRFVRKMKGNIPIVLTLDNWWTGSWRQWLGVLSAPFFLKRSFTHAWVPGPKQVKFAKKLGFGKSTITGFYCADTALFNAKFKASFDQKKLDFPKRLLYAARYVKHKGIFELWEAFAALQEEQPNDWELWCLGTGEEWENKMIHPKIKHLGFVQPAEMDDFIAKTGVYVLPSHFEPWGVSVQEFAIAGFPLVLSYSIGSAVQFLDGNGFLVDTQNPIELRAALKKVMKMSSDELIEMGLKSHEIGMAYSPQDWAKKIIELS